MMIFISAAWAVLKQKKKMAHRAQVRMPNFIQNMANEHLTVLYIYKLFRLLDIWLFREMQKVLILLIFVHLNQLSLLTSNPVCFS